MTEIGQNSWKNVFWAIKAAVNKFVQYLDNISLRKTFREKNSKWLITFLLLFSELKYGKILYFAVKVTVMQFSQFFYESQAKYLRMDFYSFLIKKSGPVSEVTLIPNSKMNIVTKFQVSNLEK